MSDEPSRRTSVLPVFIALAILVVFLVVFAIEFLDLSKSSSGVEEADLTADTYMDIVTPLLENADASRGEALVTQYGCSSCHAGNNAGRLAPAHAEVANVAAERRPPLTAAAYVYESIIYPGAFVVEGYTNNMPRIYVDQIPDADLGDIIAYLISTDH